MASKWRCVVCGADLGWDRPSGVCSEACLRVAQGFPPGGTTTDVRVVKTPIGLMAAECGEWRVVAHAMGGYSINRRVGRIGWCLLPPGEECPEDIERALCDALGIRYEP